MARLNTSNPVGQYGRHPTLTKPPTSLFSKGASSPLRPKPKTTKQTTEQKSGSLDFKIFEDAQSTDEEEAGVHQHLQAGSQTAAAAPLKLAHANSITSGLSKRASQDSSSSASNRSRRSSSDEDDEENSDKENVFVDDEAEEASEEEEEPVGEEDPELDEEPGQGFNNPQSPAARRQLPRYMRYREQEAEVESDTQSERSAEDEDGYGSLEDFIVSDNEDISYHDSEDDLPDEEEEEVKPPSPKPRRRRLMRGRKPQEAGINLEKLTISEEETTADPPTTSPASNKDTTSPRFTPNFTRPVPESHDEKATARSKTEKAKRRPLRESINSLPSISDSPTKKRLDRRQETPPPSPPKTALPTPSKTSHRIPPSPHRPSSDAFWSQEVTNSWNDQWSPPKKGKNRALERLLAELEIDMEEDSSIRPNLTQSRETTPEMTVKTPSKTALKRAEAAQRKETAARKKAFDDRKSGLAQDFLATLDDMVSGGQVKNMTASTGGIKIAWSKTLRNTAGRANWRRQMAAHQKPGKTIQYNHQAYIELAEHIIDDEDRLLNTIAHEYCHLANYMISNVRDQPHGASFKAWGYKCTEAVRKHPEYKKYPIEVTTKHSYKINYKYVWICADCGHEYGRHSKSIDPTRALCSLCKGSLQQIKPKPRNVSPKKKSPNAAAAASTVGTINVIDSSEVISLL